MEQIFQEVRKPRRGHALASALTTALVAGALSAAAASAALMGAPGPYRAAATLALGPEGAAPARRRASDLAEARAILRSPPVTAALARALSLDETVADRWLARALSLASAGDRRIVEIRAWAEAPALAARLANAAAAQFRDARLEAGFEAARRAAAFRAEKLVELRRDAAGKARALAALRETAGEEADAAAAGGALDARTAAIDVLGRNAETARIAYETFRRQAEAAAAEARFGAEPIRIIAPATAPTAPSAPPPAALIGVAGLVGGALALLFVGARRRGGPARRRLGDPATLERLSGAPTIATLPPPPRRALRATSRGRRRARRAQEERAWLEAIAAAIRDAASPLAEALRRIEQALADPRRRVDAPEARGARVVLTAAAEPGAPAALCALLAASAAAGGRRALWLDADLDQPRDVSLEPDRSKPDLVAALYQDALFDQAVERSPELGCDRLRAHRVGPKPTALSSADFAALLDELRIHYDLIALEAPCAAPAAASLAPMADHVLFAVGPGAAAARRALEALEALRRAGGRIDGLVLTGPASAAAASRRR